MATPVGTTYALFKKALIETLQSDSNLVNVAVNYSAPVQAVDITGDTGLFEAIYFMDPDTNNMRLSAIEGDQSNVIICSTPLQIDEVYEVPLAIAVMMPEEETQDVVDIRADELLYRVMKAIASNPGMGVKDPANHPEVVHCYATQGEFAKQAGLISDDGAGRGSGWSLRIKVKARLQYATVA